jgi:hypothetical protein
MHPRVGGLRDAFQMQGSHFLLSIDSIKSVNLPLHMQSASSAGSASHNGRYLFAVLRLAHRGPKMRSGGR